MTDIETTRKLQAELKQAFAEMFPLASEFDLPWAACQIKAFLVKRIEQEVEARTFHFTSRVVRILCEVAPPKTHVEDMARIVVERAKEADRLVRANRDLQEKLERAEGAAVKGAEADA